MTGKSVVVITAHGTPVPQGSKNAYVVGKRAVVVDKNSKKLKAWRETVTAAARAVHPDEPLAGPVAVNAQFYMPRPKSVSVKTRPQPHVAPDVDKLLRAVLDALTVAGVYGDDSQVVVVRAGKAYADVHPAGVVVSVDPC